MLAQETLAYWQLCQKLRSCYSEAGKAMVMYVDIPAFQGRVTSPRIQQRLKEIIGEEDQQENSGA